MCTSWTRLRSYTSVEWARDCTVLSLSVTRRVRRERALLPLWVLWVRDAHGATAGGISVTQNSTAR